MCPKSHMCPVSYQNTVIPKWYQFMGFKLFNSTQNADETRFCLI